MMRWLAPLHFTKYDGKNSNNSTKLKVCSLGVADDNTLYFHTDNEDVGSQEQQ